jgi:hypothetical protein
MRPRVPDALYQAVRPMLAASGGRIALLTTPWGRRGVFFEEWEQRDLVGTLQVLS